MNDDGNSDRKKKDDRNGKKKACTHIYIELNYIGERKKTGNRKKKKKECASFIFYSIMH
jgi:hypothetical protein